MVTKCVFHYSNNPGRIMIYLKLRNGVLFLLLIFLIVGLGAPDLISEETDSSLPVFLAHYMPWYQTPDVAGYWGWHWTMNYFNPRQTDENGRREIASHFYPLTGPYDSKDTDILEYQTLLMKISGIDGVLVDWYGMTDFRDYEILNESTQLLFNMLQKADLQFAIVYEDQTVMHMVNEGRVTASGAVQYGQQVMSYLQDNWFQTNTYFKMNNQPLLLTFGPQYFTKSSDWETMFSVLTEKPLFFTLDSKQANVAAGAYPWPPMYKSNSSGILTESALNSYLDQFYRNAESWDYLVTSVFPGFKDIYEEAGTGKSYGFLEAKDGRIFQLTMQKAMEKNSDVIQLVTWNDYGEGTIIEPTEEFGYQYLEIVQNARRQIDADFRFKAEDLKLPLQIFEIRKSHSGDSEMNALLDFVFQLIISENPDSAQALIDSVTAIGENGPNPVSFSLAQNFPNPFNPETRIEYYLSQPAQVEISVFNATGQFVTRLVSEHQKSGNHHVVWKAKGFGSGAYFYRLTAGDESIVRKCMKLN